MYLHSNLTPHTSKNIIIFLRPLLLYNITVGLSPILYIIYYISFAGTFNMPSILIVGVGKIGEY